MTVLNCAAGGGHVEVVKLLLEKGVIKEAADEDVWTPLDSAASKGRVEVSSKDITKIRS